MAVEIRAIDESAIRHPEGARRTRDSNPEEQLEISVYLKPHATHETREAREQMRARRAAEHEDDIRKITEFAAQHGLHVVRAEPERRLVRLSGSAAQFGSAFQTSLGVYDAGRGEYRGYDDSLNVPASLASSIEAVLGLDTRPIARPHLVTQAQPNVETSHRPSEMAVLYDFPGYVNGAGECIAIIELGGGYLNSDISAAFAAMSLPVPTVVAVSVDGGSNNPGHDPNADGEVALDIQVAGGLAWGAAMAVYFAPNTTQGFIDAISAAAHDTTNRPSVISISWGAPEVDWAASPMAMTAMNNALADAGTLGVSVFAASGDSLATDGINDGNAHVDFPAASRFAIGCGGTTIDTSGSSIQGEVVWNFSGQDGTGGGISDYTPVPAFQTSTALPPSVNDGGHRRGVPDVAGNADPNSGYLIVIGGQTAQIGGTSAVAPLWAGLAARLNQMMPSSQTAGFFLPGLYQFPTAGRDITQGNNRTASYPAKGYDAGPGWDACTGLGAPDGNMVAMMVVPTAKVAAVEWGDSATHLRVYCQDHQDVIQEYCWDGSGWAPGIALPGAAPYSQPTAVQWTDSGGVHIRVYYQDKQNDIVELCWDNLIWQQGHTFTGAAVGTGIAAVRWTDGGGLHIRLYYQNAQNTIVEQCWDGGWASGMTFAATGPVTGITAVQWTDGGGLHLRLYYQNAQNTIVEKCWDGGWTQGIGFTSGGPAGGVAAIQWTDGGGLHLRLYYQGAQNTIIEQCWDGGWTTGNVFSGVAPGTGIAAVGWFNQTGGIHVRLYFQDTQNAIVEQCWDGGWTKGEFAVPTK